MSSNEIVWHTGEVIYVCKFPYQICRQTFGPNNPMNFQLDPFKPYFAMTLVGLGYTIKRPHWHSLTSGFQKQKDRVKPNHTTTSWPFTFSVTNLRCSPSNTNGAWPPVTQKWNCYTSGFSKPIQRHLWHGRVQIPLQDNKSEQALTQSGNNMDLGWNKCLILPQLKFQIHLYN